MSEKIVTILKYLPAILVGLCTPLIISMSVRGFGDLFNTFEHVADIDGLNANSAVWLGVSASDSFILLLISFIILLVFRTIRSVLPFDYLMVFFLQLPLLFISLRQLSYSFDISHVYGVGSAIHSAIGCSSFLICFVAIQQYNKRNLANAI